MMLYTILQLAAGAVIIMQVAMFFEKDEVEVEEAQASPFIFLFLIYTDAKFTKYIMKRQLAQLGERHLTKVKVVGSTPTLFLLHFQIYFKEWIMMRVNPRSRKIH